MNGLLRITIFFLLNFGALAIGGLFTGSGVSSSWYEGLDKAPWTPPGWVFGAAWTTIMISYSFYMAILYRRIESRAPMIRLFALQWLLNVSWNPLFFYLKNPYFALINIVLLTGVVITFFIRYYRASGAAGALIVPYGVWLLLATSLNLYIVIYN